MSSDSEDDYDALSDISMSEPLGEGDMINSTETPLTAPQTPHSLRSSDTKTLTCPYLNCNKSFNRKARLNEHLRSHTKERPFKCTEPGCGKDFPRSSHLSRHVKSAHSNIRNYQCTWSGCDKSFSTGTRLRRHEEAHKGRQQYQCTGYEDCDQTFRKHDTLRRHVLSVHEQKRPFPCAEESCEQAFETAEKLRSHVRAKHNHSRFTCSVCLEAAKEAVLEDEMDEYDDDPFKFWFSTYSDLQAHIALAHPPACDFCPLVFETQKALTRHLELQHKIVADDGSEPKPAYPCTYPDCGRVFTKNGNLNVHIKTVHERRRDYVCGREDVAVTIGWRVGDGCGRDFTSKASLEEHIRTVHQGRESKRTERQNKRKHERSEGHDVTASTQEPQIRKPRKDKGLTRTSALSRLLGEGKRFQKPEDFSIFEDEDKYEDAEMSGSITMYGSQLFHRDSSNEHGSPPTEQAETPEMFAYQENLENVPNYEFETEDYVFNDFDEAHDVRPRTFPLDPLLVNTS